MPTLRFSLKDPDDAHVDDTWMIYHAFIGRYYQRAVDSHAGIQMCKEYPDEWYVPFNDEEFAEVKYVALQCKVFTAIFNVRES